MNLLKWPSNKNELHYDDYCQSIAYTRRMNSYDMDSLE